MTRGCIGSTFYAGSLESALAKYDYPSRRVVALRQEVVGLCEPPAALCPSKV